MTLEEIQSICDSFNGVTQNIKWNDHLCFNVGGKMFLVTAPDHVPVSASIKVRDEDFATLTQKQGITPAPYMARYNWIYLDDISRFSKIEWSVYIKNSYDLVFSKLPSKTKNEIAR